MPSLSANNGMKLVSPSNGSRRAHPELFVKALNSCRTQLVAMVMLLLTRDE